MPLSSTTVAPARFHRAPTTMRVAERKRIQALLATGDALPLDAWRELARTPEIFAGWNKLHRKGTLPLVQAASRLAVAEVAGLLAQAPLALNTPSSLSPRGASPLYSPLAAALRTIPHEDPRYADRTTPWTAEQRMAQEIVVGLLLAAGATLDPSAWAFAAHVQDEGQGYDEEDTQPRLLQRLLATGQSLPAVLTTHGEGDTTLLHQMAERRGPWPAGMVEAVIARGVDVNARNARGATALHVVASGLEFDAQPLAFVRTLLAHGADPSIADLEGYWPVHRAALQRVPDAPALAALIEAGVALDSVRVIVPLLAAQTPNPQNLDLQTTRQQGLMPVHLAVLFPFVRTDALDRLLAAGVDPNVPDRGLGNTALHWAVWARRPQAVERLLHHGATPTRANHAGQLPRDFLDQPALFTVGAVDEQALQETLRPLLERHELRALFAPQPSPRSPSSPASPVEPAGLSSVLPIPARSRPLRRL